MTSLKLAAGLASLTVLVSTSALAQTSLAQTAPVQPAAATPAAPTSAETPAEATPVARPVRPTVASLTADLAVVAGERDAARLQAADLTSRLDRQTLIAQNAQAELKAQRDAGKLKDELLVLGRERNKALYQTAEEILQKYADIDLREKVSRREPFVQAKRVELETAVQTYEDRLRAARIDEHTLPPSLERRMQSDVSASESAPAATPTAQ